MVKRHKLFVYGTLRPHAEDKTLWYVPGTAMFNLGRFPAAAESRYFRVIGNILDVDDEELAAFDKYEGVDQGFYTREEVNCLRVDGEEGIVTAWMYFAGEEIQAFIAEAKEQGAKLRIPSGDWYEAR